ncbi:hypothetical protein [Bowmanella denitrificans]|uniref:hypothetical protein n=1 Tax=Bowmanella denitrificans TaxID=366582 RepID=UPI000C9CC9FC|nr:hypothetical protein [Bowmanella denitrificans]
MTKRYLGGKGQPGVYHTIINQMPVHDLYIEPFLGGGSVMRYKRPAKRSIGMDLFLPALQQFQQAYLHALPGCELHYGNALDFLRYGSIAGLWGHETLIYLDPPYPHTTRTSNARYANELTNAQHSALLTTITDLDCNVMISTYPNPLYAEHLKDWRLVEHTSVASSGQVREEHLYCNFAEPTYLHDDRYLGDNNDKRIDIARRITRNKKKLLEWTPAERARLLRELAESLPEEEKQILQCG